MDNCAKNGSFKAVLVEFCDGLHRARRLNSAVVEVVPRPCCQEPRK